MKDIKKTICPICGKEYSERPALSRDNVTIICPTCGTREALMAMGVAEEGIERIINLANEYSRKYGE